MSAIKNLYFKDSGKSLPAVAPPDKDPSEYPAKFFQKELKKPSVVIPQSEASLDLLRPVIKYQISNSKLELPIAKLYLFKFFQEHPVCPDQDWRSFDILIAAKGNPIDAFAPLTVVFEPAMINLECPNKDSQLSEKDDRWMVLFLLSVYRIGKAPNQNYKNKLIAELTRMMQTHGQGVTAMMPTLTALDAWPNDVNYCKMIASIDMFYSKFKNEELGFVRFGTIPSRFKDCSALVAMSHFQSLLGLELWEGLQWSFVPKVTKEIEMMLEPGQELDKPDSYMPYMMEFGISRVSPYSSSRNTAWHLFVHTIGCLMTSRRSINARHLEASDQSNILANAALVAFVFQTRHFWEKGITIDGAKDASDAIKPRASPALSIGSMPTSTLPDDWFAWLKLRRFEIPQEIKDAAAKSAGKITDAREGSVGSFIKLKYQP